MWNIREEETKVIPQIRKWGDEGMKLVWLMWGEQKEDCERKKISMKIIGILFPFFDSPG